MSDLNTLERVGFIGLGNMGVPMVGRLVAGGYRVQANDLSPAARARAVDAGAVEAPDLAAAARGVDVLILMLPDSQIVSAVLSDEALLAELRDGLIVIDMGSSEPARTRELASDLSERGIRMMDAPVSGGVKGAVEGKLTVMVGADPSDFAISRTLLSRFGRTVHAGPVGAGHVVKSLNNLLSATHLWVTSEAIEAGRRFGLDPEAMLAIFNGSSGRSGSTENKWPNFILPGSYDSGFGLRLMLKDMRIAVQLAEQAGTPSVLGAAAVDLWARAAEGLPADADHTEVARWINDANSAQDALA